MAKGGRDRKCEILVINNIAQVGLSLARRSATRWSRTPRIRGPSSCARRTCIASSSDRRSARRRTRRRRREQHSRGRLSKRGIPVFNAPGANANAVKELVLAGMLIAARNLAPARLRAEAEARARSGQEDRGRQEAVRRVRAARAHAGRHRSGKDWQPGRRRGDSPGHERAGLRCTSRWRRRGACLRRSSAPIRSTKF